MNGFGGMGMCSKDNGIPSGTLLIMNEVGKTFNVKDTSWLWMVEDDGGMVGGSENFSDVCVVAC